MCLLDVTSISKQMQNISIISCKCGV